jgi:hypothetical protein
MRAQADLSVLTRVPSFKHTECSFMQIYSPLWNFKSSEGMTPVGVSDQPKKLLASMFAWQIIQNFLYGHGHDE